MQRPWPALLVAVLLVGACGAASDLAESSGNRAAAVDADRAGGGNGGSGGGNGGPDGDTDRGNDGGSNGGSDSRSQDRTDGPSVVRLRLPNVVGARPVFLTPSRNIGCAISADSVRCDILERSYLLPPKPADCQGSFGRSISVGRDGIAGFVCVTDTVIDPAAPVLAYGTSTEVGDFGCTSSEQHIACYHLESDHGFELSRESPALF
jgi:hypothetical protein